MAGGACTRERSRCASLSRRERSADASVEGAASADVFLQSALLAPLSDCESSSAAWPARRFPFSSGAVVRSCEELLTGERSKGESGAARRRASVSHARRSKTCVSDEFVDGITAFQVHSLSADVLALLRLLFLAEALGKAQVAAAAGAVASAGSLSGVYVHPISLKVFPLRLESFLSAAAESVASASSSVGVGRLTLPLPSALILSAVCREGGRNGDLVTQVSALVESASRLETLVLRGSPSWLSRLQSAFGRSSSLRRLLIEDFSPPSTAPDSWLHQYVKTLASASRSSTLYLRGCKLETPHLQTLVSQLRRQGALLRRLRELDLTDNSLTEDAALVLTDFLRSASSRTLRRLLLSGNSWGGGAEGLLNAALSLRSSSAEDGNASPLEEFSFEESNALFSVPAVASQLQQLRSVQTLDLKTSGLTSRAFRRAFQVPLPALRHLILANCKGALREEDVSLLVDALWSPASGHSILPRRVATQSRRGNASNETTALSRSSLVSLSLARNNLGPGVLRPLGAALSQSLHCSLRSLDLSGNELGATAVKGDYAAEAKNLLPLVEALQGSDDSPAARLECLFLKDCGLSASALIDIAGALLLNNGRLKVLDLRGNAKPKENTDSRGDEATRRRQSLQNCATAHNLLCDASEDLHFDAKRTVFQAFRSATAAVSGLQLCFLDEPRGAGADRETEVGAGNSQRKAKGTTLPSKTTRAAARDQRRAEEKEKNDAENTTSRRQLQRGTPRTSKRREEAALSSQDKENDSQEESLATSEFSDVTSFNSDASSSEDATSDDQEEEEEDDDDDEDDDEEEEDEEDEEEEGEGREGSAKTNLKKGARRTDSGSGGSGLKSAKTDEMSVSLSTDSSDSDYVDEKSPSHRGGVTGSLKRTVSGDEGLEECQPRKLRRREEVSTEQKQYPDEKLGMHLSGASAVVAESGRIGIRLSKSSDVHLSSPVSPRSSSLIGTSLNVVSHSSSNNLLSAPPNRGGGGVRLSRLNSSLSGAATTSHRSPQRGSGLGGAPGPLLGGVFGGGAPFLLDFRLLTASGRRDAPAALPLEETERRSIAEAVWRASLALLQSVLPSETHRSVGKSPFETLLRGPPQSVLLGLKLLLAAPLQEVSFSDVYLLRKLHRSASLSRPLRLLVALVLEELPRVNLTHKLLMTGGLDFADMLCIPGSVLFDSGPRGEASSASELRTLWNCRHAKAPSSAAINSTCASGFERETALCSSGGVRQSDRDRRRQAGEEESVVDAVASAFSSLTSWMVSGKRLDGEDQEEALKRSTKNTPVAQRTVLTEGRGGSSSVVPSPSNSSPKLFAAPAPIFKFRKAASSAENFETRTSGGATLCSLKAGQGFSNQFLPQASCFPSDASFCESLQNTTAKKAPSALSGEEELEAEVLSSPRVVFSWADWQWRQHVERCLDDRSLCPSTLGGPCHCREVLVVDVQTDEALRRKVAQAQQLFGSGGRLAGAANSSFSSASGTRQKRRVEALKKFVLRSIGTPQTAEQKREVNRLARSQCGFVAIGSVRHGESRHMALLFKVLCDSVGVPCRLLRTLEANGTERAYNLVIVPSSKDSDLESFVPITWPSPTLGTTQTAKSASSSSSSKEAGDATFLPRLNPNPSSEDFCVGPACCARCKNDPPCGAPSCLYTSQANGERQKLREDQKQAELSEAADLDVFLLNQKCFFRVVCAVVGEDSSLGFLCGVAESALSACGRGGSANEVDLGACFEFRERIGKGNFGEVWRVALKTGAGSDSSEPPIAFGGGGHATRSSLKAPQKQTTSLPRLTEYALKLVPLKDENLPEAEIMRSYRHPRVVSFLGVFKGFQMLEDRSLTKVRHASLCFLMHLADGSLESLLEAHEAKSAPLSVSFILSVLLDTARGMQYLHAPSAVQPHLLHRDLKPANILMKDNRAMVTDFGVARVAEGAYFEHEMTQGPGTEGYIAPEQRTAAYDRPADVWAFGVVAARLLGLKQWRGLSNPNNKVAVSDFAVMDPFLIKLAMSCLETDPRMRPTFDNIVNRLIEEIFRVEFERIVRSRYRDVIPIEESSRCCCALLGGARGEDRRMQRENSDEADGNASLPLSPLWPTSASALTEAAEASSVSEAVLFEEAAPIECQANAPSSPDWHLNCRTDTRSTEAEREEVSAPSNSNCDANSKLELSFRVSDSSASAMTPSVCQVSPLPLASLNAAPYPRRSSPRRSSGASKTAFVGGTSAHSQNAIRFSPPRDARSVESDDGACSSSSLRVQRRTSSPVPRSNCRGSRPESSTSPLPSKTEGTAVHASASVSSVSGGRRRSAFNSRGQSGKGSSGVSSSETPPAASILSNPQHAQRSAPSPHPSSSVI